MRGPIFGYKGASRLFRHISCDAYIASIGTPLLTLMAEDDTITDFKFVPLDELKRNPNIILATLPRGGHCNLWFQQESQNGRNGEHKELGPLVAIDYLK